MEITSKILRNHKLLIGVFFIFWLNISIGQHAYSTGEDPCSNQLYIRSKLYLDYPYNNFRDFIQVYLDQNYPTLTPYLRENAQGLIKIKRKMVLPNHLEFCNSISLFKDAKVKFYFKSDSIKVDLNLINSDDYIMFEDVISDSLGYEYFGFIKEDTTAIIIQIDSFTASIGKSNFNIGPHLFRELINPNILNKENNLLPIEVFYDNKSESIFVYIYGFIPTYSLDDEDNPNASHSFFAKIIVNKSGISKIIIPGGYLYTYGWLSCPVFWIM